MWLSLGLIFRWLARAVFRLGRRRLGHGNGREREHECHGRRDQTPERATAPVVGWDGRFGLVKVNPLVRWTFDEVKTYVGQHDVPFNPLHDQGYPSIGCMPCTSAVKPGATCTGAFASTAWHRP